MNTFIQWAGETKKELPLYKQNESTKRRVIAHWMYPSAAGRGNYPENYFMPYAADAMQKMGYGVSKNGKKPNDKAPPDDAP